jgi:hypothetical protein
MRECCSCGILKNSSCSSTHRQQGIAMADPNSLPSSAAEVTVKANDAATLSAAADTNVHGRNALSGPDVDHAGCCDASCRQGESARGLEGKVA